MALEGPAQFYGVAIVMKALSIIVVLARIYVRAIMLKKVGPDDYLMVAAWFSSLVVMAIHFQRMFSSLAIL